MSELHKLGYVDIVQPGHCLSEGNMDIVRVKVTQTTLTLFDLDTVQV